MSPSHSHPTTPFTAGFGALLWEMFPPLQPSPPGHDDGVTRCLCHIVLPLPVCLSVLSQQEGPGGKRRILLILVPGTEQVSHNVTRGVTERV